MTPQWTLDRRRAFAWLAVLLLFMALAAGVVPSRALALTNSQVTLDRETGAQPIRYSFKTMTDSFGSISAIDLTFPDGFDPSDSKTVVVTVKGLERVPVEYKTAVSGNTVTATFDPPLKANTDLRVTINNVMTPAKGGTYALKISYVLDGNSKAADDVKFSFATPPTGELIAHWLDRQSLVAEWNSVPFFNLFLQPQYAALAFSTVWAGWLISIALVAIAFPLAIIGGLGLAFMKMAKVRLIRWPASGYINVVRGTPLFLQIAIAFVGLPIAGMRFPWFPTGVIVLALNSSAYLAEIFRAGIQSISKGQFEAAASLGMTYPQAMRFVIIPQTLKRVLPTMTSEFILLFKDTALLSAVGVFELMLYSNNIVARSGNITPFMVAAVFYLIITIPLINYVGTLERKLAISEGGQVPETKKERDRRRLAADVIAETTVPATGRESR